jgi:hypothetical protein
MRRFIALIALTLIVGWFTAGPAHAAPPPCYPWEPQSTGLEATTQPSNFIDWLRTPDAKASIVATEWCDAKYSWVPGSVYMYRSELRADWQTVLQALPTMSHAQLDALFIAGVQAGSDPELKPLADRQLSAKQPPPIVWLTRPNNGNDQRTVFGLKADGTRDLKAIPDRVKVGVPCDCLTKALEEPISGTDNVNTYCSVSGLTNPATGAALPPGRVAWCVRQ